MKEETILNHSWGNEQWYKVGEEIINEIKKHEK